MDLRYAVDLARGFAPLTFDRQASPDGLEPKILHEAGGSFLRLAVQRGAYGDALRGEPASCDRCELRDPEKLPMGLPVWHAFSIRVPVGFPEAPARFVAAQVKANGDASPLLALRVDRGRLFADWRLGAVTVEHRDSLTGPGGCWTDILLFFAADRAELWANGRRITAARTDFLAAARMRYLKLGPYRDKSLVWGDAPAAIDFRNIRRGFSRADVELLDERRAA